ncbi:MAG: hydrogenase maturation nickel metallochaperone HypA [Candidatus Electrothrix sp. AR4]|nr:hydrogenase maturation nickel metallochaperone HypA [Candidatus Electrothrix sp. AR4]
MLHSDGNSASLDCHLCAMLLYSESHPTMHEFSICHTLVEKLLEEADKLTPPPVRVIKIRVVCGRLRQIVPEYLETAYEALTKDTIAEQSVLEIREIPIVGRCAACGWKGELAVDYDFACPACTAPIPEVISGQELYLETIEIEQDDKEEN